LKRFIVRQQVEPRDDPRPAPVLWFDILNFDDERVARFGAANRDRSRELMEHFKIERIENSDRRLFCNLVSRNFRRIEQNRVARIDFDHWRQIAVPAVMCSRIRYLMGSRHAFTPHPPEPDTID
jgi:hypothetical protein